MNLLELIKTAFANLASLTEDELTAMRKDIVKCAAEFKGDDTDENVAALVELGDMADAVGARSAEIATAKAEAAAKAEEARKRISALDEPETPEAEVEVPVAEVETAETEVETPLPVAASASDFTSTPEKMSRGRVVAISPELSVETRSHPVLTASAQSRLKGFGEEIDDRWELADVMADRLEGLSEDSVTGKQLVASARWGDLYSSERTLSSKNTLENAKKIDKEIGPKALAASGGVCLPTNVDYSIDTWATTDRPLRDGLPTFSVDRGGLIFRRSAAIGTLSGATVVWTNANDITPSDPTVKPVLQIECATPDQVFVNAIATRLGFGNLMGQFDPETIAANTDLAMAEAARIAELSEWASIQTFATSVTAGAQFGAARDFIAQLIQVTSAFRFTNRLSRDQVVTIIAPVWGLDLLKVDRVREQAHDSAGTNVFSIPDSEITDWLMGYKIKAIWMYDGLTANAGGGTYAAQTFAAFSGGAAIPTFPTVMMWNVFIEGSLQFLDGGRLDLGVVRDATLDATNDYETFVEPFENVAWRGFDGGLLQVVSTLTPTGSASEPIAYS